MDRRRVLWIVLLAAAVLPYFVNLGATSIVDANEAFYAETPREMIKAGDYLNSTFNFEPRFNKPPLSYWIVAGSYHVLGVNLTAARLPIAAGAVVMIVTAFWLARLAFSTRAAWWAAITLAATPRFLLFARRIIIDIYSAMFLGLTLLFFALAEAQPARRRYWLIAMYVAVGLGVITKGPVAIVIPALVFPVYLAATGRLRTVGRMMIAEGAIIVSAIVLPYYAALYLEHGWDYITTFLVRENFARYAEGVGAPDRGPLFYLPVVFTDLYFPWSLLLPVGLAFVPWRRLAAWPGWRGIWCGGADAPVGPEHVRLLLGLWIVLIVAFYSASQAQQDLYVLPFIVAGAALVGGLIEAALAGDGAPSRLDRWARGSLAVMFGVLLVLGLAVAWYVGRPGAPVFIAGTGAAGVVLTSGALAGLVSLARRWRTAAVAAVAGALIVASWIVVLVALPDFERYKPVRRLARIIQRLPDRPAHVGMYKVAAPSLVFYLRRHVDQLFDEDQLIAFLSRGDGACLLIHDDDYFRLPGHIRRRLRLAGRSVRLTGRLTEFINPGPLPRMFLVTLRTPPAR